MSERGTKSLTESEILAQVPPPEEGAVFSLVKVEGVAMPHPYCIGTRHVVEAADHFGGMLGAAALESCDKKEIYCCTCEQLARTGRHKILKYSEHENLLTLFIKVPQNHDLNGVLGLHQYLLSVKAKCSELGIEGFAFPTT